MMLMMMMMIMNNMKNKRMIEPLGMGLASRISFAMCRASWHRRLVVRVAQVIVSDFAVCRLAFCLLNEF